MTRFFLKNALIRQATTSFSRVFRPEGAQLAVAWTWASLHAEAEINHVALRPERIVPRGLGDERLVFRLRSSLLLQAAQARNAALVQVLIRAHPGPLELPLRAALKQSSNAAVISLILDAYDAGGRSLEFDLDFSSLHHGVAILRRLLSLRYRAAASIQISDALLELALEFDQVGEILDAFADWEPDIRTRVIQGYPLLVLAITPLRPRAAAYLFRADVIQCVPSKFLPILADTSPCNSISAMSSPSSFQERNPEMLSATPSPLVAVWATSISWRFFSSDLTSTSTFSAR